jgi:UDP-xylose:glucoside alpha-1,3-xylosyltransferase
MVKDYEPQFVCSAVGYEFLATNYAPCASLRLFFPQLLSDHDSAIYLDTDLLFFQDPRGLSSYFSTFNEGTMAAMAADQYGFCPEHFVKEVKYPGKSGVNSGIILMNLTRMRENSWIPSIQSLRDSEVRTFDQVIRD